MNLLHRLSRLFMADMHGILDALEEPEVMLKQAVREMQEEIEATETQLAALSRRLERFAARTEELNAALREFDAQLDFCFAANDEALIKNQLRKKLETQQVLQSIAGQQRTLHEQQAALQTELAQRRDKLQSILDKMALFAERHAEPVQGNSITESEFPGGKTVTREDVELAYLKEKQQRAQRQARQEQQS